MSDSIVKINGSMPTTPVAVESKQQQTVGEVPVFADEASRSRKQKEEKTRNMKQLTTTMGGTVIAKENDAVLIRFEDGAEKYFPTNQRFDPKIGDKIRGERLTANVNTRDELFALIETVKAKSYTSLGVASLDGQEAIGLFQHYGSLTVFADSDLSLPGRDGKCFIVSDNTNGNRLVLSTDQEDLEVLLSMVMNAA